MAVVTEYIQLSTKGNAEVVDITHEVQMQLKRSGLKSGIVNVLLN